MSLWFDEGTQREKLLRYFPRGRIYKQAYVPTSNFGALITWIASMFEYLTKAYNSVFKGLFVAEDDYMLARWKEDYGIPNTTFYEASARENLTDIFVLKYLMKGNSLWYFQAVASIYGLDMIFETGLDAYKESSFPHHFPYYFKKDVFNQSNLLFIEIASDLKDENIQKRVEKVKKIYDIMKPVTTVIKYTDTEYTYREVDKRAKFPMQFPYVFGVKTRVRDQKIEGVVTHIDFSKQHGVGL